MACAFLRRRSSAAAHTAGPSARRTWSRSLAPSPCSLRPPRATPGTSCRLSTSRTAASSRAPPSRLRRPHPCCGAHPCALVQTFPVLVLGRGACSVQGAPIFQARQHMQCQQELCSFVTLRLHSAPDLHERTDRTVPHAKLQCSDPTARPDHNPSRCFLPLTPGRVQGPQPQHALHPRAPGLAAQGP